MQSIVKIPVIGFLGLYEAHSNGRIFSLIKDKYLAQGDSTYPMSVLCKVGTQRKVYNHRIIAECFIPNPLKKKYINHKNGNKWDNRPENLEWCTPQENIAHAFRYGLNKVEKGDKNAMFGRTGFNSNRGKSVNQIDINTGQIVKTWGSAAEASRNIGVSRAQITSCCRNQNIKSRKFRFQYKQSIKK